MDDLALARRAAAGDRSALAALYDRYADPLYAFVHHRLDAGREEVEDVWRETWLAALEGLEQFRGRGAFFTWLGGIARRKIADHCRRLARQPAVLLGGLPEGELASLIDRGPLPEDVVSQRAFRVRVVEALAVLPDDYRVALLLRHADGLAVEEVARQLHRGYKATASLLVRARRAFQVALAQLDREVTDGGP